MARPGAGCRKTVMHRAIMFAACLLIANTALTATPTADEHGANWFEATIADSLRRLHPGNSADRARYMACGYVAPALIRANAEEAAKNDDSTYAGMLERLRAILRPSGEGR